MKTPDQFKMPIVSFDSCKFNTSASDDKSDSFVIAVLDETSPTAELSVVVTGSKFLRSQFKDRLELLKVEKLPESDEQFAVLLNKTFGNKHILATIECERRVKGVTQYDNDGVAETHKYSGVSLTNVIIYNERTAKRIMKGLEQRDTVVEPVDAALIEPVIEPVVE
jgi:hypothetical protein